MSAWEKSCRKYFIYRVKPSHCDEQGYIIQWRRFFVPSNTLACVLVLVEDIKARSDAC